MSKLKPCPFCGCKTIIRLLELSIRFYQACCPIYAGGCGASTAIVPTWKQAVAAWNRRTKLRSVRL